MASLRTYKELVKVVPAPVKGVNMISAVDKLQVDEALDIRGYEFQEYGVLGLPWGSTEIGTPNAGAIICAHVFQKEGSTTQLIIQGDDGTLRYSSNFITATHVSPSTWTTIATGLSTTARFSFVTYLDAVYMCNGVDDYRKWDGAAQTLYSTVPKFKYLAVWKDAIWGAGVTANPHRLYRSDFGDGAVWGALNFVDIEKGDGLGISALAPEINELVVFKYLNTHAMYDPIEFLNRLVDPDKGSVSHWATVTHNGRLYFLSGMGVCLYTGDGPSQIVSERIQPVFDDLRTATDPTKFIRVWGSEANTCAVSFEDHIDFRIPMYRDDLGNDTASWWQLYPDYPERPWLRSGPDGLFAVSVREKNAPQEYYELNAGTLFRRYSEIGVTVNGRWWTSWQDFDAPIDEKYLHTVVLLARGLFNLGIFKDFDYSNSALPEVGSGVVGTGLGVGTDGTQMADVTVYTDAYGKAFQLNLQHVTTGGDFVQRISSGQNTPVTVHRYGGSVSRIVLRARLLGEGYR